MQSWGSGVTFMALGIFWVLNITTPVGEGSDLVAVQASGGICHGAAPGVTRLPLSPRSSLSSGGSDIIPRNMHLPAVGASPWPGAPVLASASAGSRCTGAAAAGLLRCGPSLRARGALRHLRELALPEQGARGAQPALGKREEAQLALSGSPTSLGPKRPPWHVPESRPAPLCEAPAWEPGEDSGTPCVVPPSQGSPHRPGTRIFPGEEELGEGRDRAHTGPRWAWPPRRLRRRTGKAPWPGRRVRTNARLCVRDRAGRAGAGGEPQRAALLAMALGAPSFPGPALSLRQPANCGGPAPSKRSLGVSPPPPGQQPGTAWPSFSRRLSGRACP